MSGRSIPPENLELAYKAWIECGQNVTKTIQSLKNKHGFSVTAPTLYSWRDKNDWVGRVARFEVEKDRLESAADHDVILNELITQKQRYIDYFDSLPAHKVDTQATYAYVSIVKAINDHFKPVDKLKTANEVEDVIKKQGLTDETVELIKAKILGVVQ